MIKECGWCWSHPRQKDGMRHKHCMCSQDKGWDGDPKSNKNHSGTKRKLEHRKAKKIAEKVSNAMKQIADSWETNG